MGKEEREEREPDIYKIRDNDSDIKSGIQGNAMASGMHGHQCAQVRIQVQVQGRHLIVRVDPPTRTMVPGTGITCDRR